MAELASEEIGSEHEEKPTLLHFDTPGKTEAIRLAFHWGKIPFDEFRFKDREELKQMKLAGKLKIGQVPGQLPALVVQGKKTLSQSGAILRYIGRQAGLYPEDPVVAAQIDAIIDEEADALMGLRITKYMDPPFKEPFGFAAWITDDGDVESRRDEINQEIIPKRMALLEAAIITGRTDWLAGTPGPTIADFFWVPIFQMIQSGEWGVPASVMKPFKQLQKLVKRFLALPAIAEYYAQK
eukprot:TRINITY_DN81017_c0_g1_i1.p1 TRINITY_DN81017_c0_g1~~TRINITY_DN81017_c0_g1_i1.p1  ORF type:complete len:239 (-),score=59.00 TRINITY_DN81017_c0_g1_i1:232-948(-)